MSKFNKKDLVQAVAKDSKFSQTDVQTIVEATLENIKKGTLEVGSCQIMGFGVFKVVERKERKGRNPQTGAEMIIPAKKVVKFKPSF